MRRTSKMMGSTASLDIPGCNREAVFDGVFVELFRLERKFSPFRSSSELCRFQRGSIKKSQLSQEMKAVIVSCADWHNRTSGYFSAYYSGQFDPTGYVKGWAIAKGGEVIEEHGYKTYCLSIGGDILARSNSAKVWQIGIQDPFYKKKILNKLSISNGSVATSGTYERGSHIVNPKTGRPADSILGATVVGPDIAGADVLSTAVFIMGEKGLDYIEGVKDYEALLVTNDGRTLASHGMRRLLLGP